MRLGECFSVWKQMVANEAEIANSKKVHHSYTIKVVLFMMDDL